MPSDKKPVLFKLPLGTRAQLADLATFWNCDRTAALVRCINDAAIETLPIRDRYVRPITQHVELKAKRMSPNAVGTIRVERVPIYKPGKKSL